MNGVHMKKIYSLLILFLAVFIIFIHCAESEDSNYQDGIFEGEHSFIKVCVKVEEGKISDIEILQHGGGGEKYEKMIEPLIFSIIENQSTEVDSVTGATVSSVNLKKAVGNALQAKEKNQE